MSENPRTTWKFAAKLVVVAATMLGVVFSPIYLTFVQMPGSSHSGALPPLDAAQRALVPTLKGHVEVLASEIGERHILSHPEALEEAALYVERQFSEMGYVVTWHEYEVMGHLVRNLVVELPGEDRASEIVVIGAHYDSARGTPGADDNASGTAALLALASHFAGQRFPRTVRFVAFVNEEPPWFWTEHMGSLQYARGLALVDEDVVGMLSLETVAYYTDEPGTQNYPFPFSLFYPNQGNFIGFVGNVGSRSLVRSSVRHFRSSVEFPSEGAALPSQVRGVGWSDQWAFWEVGYSAVMVTDTAPNRNPHYHELTDTPDKLDFERMARVVSGLQGVVSGLATDSRRAVPIRALSRAGPPAAKPVTKWLRGGREINRLFRSIIRPARLSFPH